MHGIINCIMKNFELANHRLFPLAIDFMFEDCNVRMGYNEFASWVKVIN